MVINRCYVSIIAKGMNLKHITTTMLLLVVASLSFNTVYADVVPMPQLPSDNMIDKKVWTQFSANNTYTVNIAVLYQVDSPLEVPNTITWMDITGQVHTINLSDEFSLSNGLGGEDEPADDGPTPQEDAERAIEEVKQERQKTIDELYEDALLCTFGDDPATIEVEGRSVWQADAQFEIAKEMAYFKHLPDSYQEREFLLKTQECETFMSSWMYDNAQYNSIAEAQKTDIQPWVLDESNSPDTPDTFTEEDFKAEEQRAEDFKCSVLGMQMNMCDGEFTGDLYEPTFNKPSWYGTYEDQRDSDPELADALEEALLTQCLVYYPIYNATASIELPSWLQHCAEN